MIRAAGAGLGTPVLSSSPSPLIVHLIGPTHPTMDLFPSSPLKKAIVAIFDVGHATTSCRRASQTSDLAIACLSETSCFA